MSGWLTDGLTQLEQITGAELFPVDVQNASGAAPETGAVSTLTAFLASAFYNSFLSKTTVAGSRYFYGPITIGAPSGQGGVVTLSAPRLITGVNVLVGGTGGTDNWIAELHDSAGNLVATSNPAGILAGTAGQWQQFPFYSGGALPYQAAPGSYYIAIQSNGTTATLACFNAPVFPLFTGSHTGAFGTGASITPPLTYTADLGPVAFLF